MQETSFTGGARIGWINASWPFAKLNVSREKIVLTTLGKYEFSPDQVVSFEPHGLIPVIASGIRINHNRPDYPGTIIFWYPGLRNTVLSSFAQCGFQASGKAQARPQGMPMRWSVIIAMILIWNVLFFLDLPPQLSPGSAEPGPFQILALVSACAFATAAKLSTRLQNLIMGEGRYFGEVKSFFVLMQLLTGALAVGFGLMYFLR
ncbi:hypothetical protein H8L32_09015 [Undibacterium sp. CY18W]|uniref:Uncharacterized protein n=1 Tax=Undibacterium hunanense TaxID=2762292 RepID=A0ABR6ZQ59_9BURK|nr:hypothetical protein [Undibacterium hunanense]MBC3917610.1 hypothetical protein [Undibacterium hunanense]